LNWSDSSIIEAGNLLKKFKTLVKSVDITKSEIPAYDDEMIDILSDDLNTPEAIKYLSQVAKSSKKNKKDLIKLVSAAKFIGLDILKEKRHPSHDNIDEKTIEQLIKERLDARRDGDYEKADKIREKLLTMNISIKDLEGSTVWDYNPD
jgi:cysteinyl-tRNA synthetase